MGLEMGISGPMTVSSLSDVLNDLAGGQVAALADTLRRTDAVTELDLFLEQDALLSSLNNQYRFAREHHMAARKEHGRDSPMADIAADMEDSAWCAMQTRLMELRGNGALMRLVQKKLWEAEVAALAARQALKEKKALDFFNRMEAARLAKERNKSTAIYEWLAVIIIYHRYLRLPFPALGIQEQSIAA